LNGYFTLYVPAKNANMEYVRTDVVDSGPNGTMKISCGYGMQGGRVEIRIPTFPEVVKQLCPQDKIKVTFADGNPHRPLQLRVVNVKWAPPVSNDPGAWAYFIQADFESSWNLRRRVIANVHFEKMMDYVDTLQQIFDSVFLSPDDKPTIDPGKQKSSRGIFSYPSYFLDGYISLAQVVEDIVDENKCEWYCDPFDNSICVGSPVATRSLVGGSSNTTNGITRYQFFQMSGKMFASFVFDGTVDALIGSSIVIDGSRWKVIKCEYGARGNGYKECTGIAIMNKHVCGKKTNQWFTRKDIDTRQYYDVERQTKIVDIVDPSSGDKKVDSYATRNTVKWARKGIKRESEQELPMKDMRQYEFLDGYIIDNVIVSTPFAGDGVGLKFPFVDTSRHLLIFPEKKGGYSIIDGAIWKAGDAIPKCEPKDLYLRMEKGSLYFDEANETWLVKAKNVKLEAARPDAADTKPDPTKTDGTFVKLESGGIITIEGTTINLGKDASDPVARKSDLQAIVDMINGHGHETVMSLGTPTGPTAATPPLPYMTTPACSSTTNSE